MTPLIATCRIPGHGGSLVYMSYIRAVLILVFITEAPTAIDQHRSFLCQHQLFVLSLPSTSTNYIQQQFGPSTIPMSGRGVYQVVIRSSANQKEPKKTILSNGLYDMFMWHIWAVISVSASIVLLWLNYTEYAIAGEIGGSLGTSANFLGMLQFAVKAHEITIIASLYMIARQWIQRTLIDLDKGIPLGLLGAENVLGQPSFLISKGYLVAVSYVVSLWRSKQGRLDLFLLMLFLSAATIVSSLAGPASGVLMIPIKDWFLEPAWAYPGPPAPNYPYIMVRPIAEYIDNHRPHVADVFNRAVFDAAAPSFSYWSYFIALTRFSEFVPQTESTHDITTGTTSARVNISSTPGRSLDNGNTGRTYATSIMANEVSRYSHWMLSRNIMVELSPRNKTESN